MPDEVKQTPRARVARVIDPHAFTATPESYHGREIAPGLRAEAYAKADAIISLLMDDEAVERALVAEAEFRVETCPGGYMVIRGCVSFGGTHRDYHSAAKECERLSMRAALTAAYSPKEG